MIKKHFASFAVLLTLFFTSCVSNSKTYSESTFSEPAKVEAKWTNLNAYAEAFDFFIEEPKALCHAVKIDLKNPDLSISTFPGVYSGPLYTVTSASRLSKSYDIVINTSPFTYSKKSLSLKAPVGILQSHEIPYSDANSKYCALALYEKQDSWSAKIIQSQGFIPEPEKDETLIAIHGGFWQILKDGRQIDFIDNHDSRTACGLSKDGKYLYILIVEGEVKSSSEGLSYNECATVFEKLGAWNAMQFDGGSSTCLYINSKNALKYPKNPVLPAFLTFGTK